MTLGAARPVSVVVVCLGLAVPMAQAAESGAEAFDRRDFDRAAVLWREEAAQGSARAKLGLGMLYDLGLGTPRDAAKALRWYLGAAEGGLPEAQFNAGVMLDAGAGGMREAAAAAVWYARAAANGHRRAQYNLGLLFEAGEGVARNPDLARYWYGQAAETLPAAAERRRATAPAGAGARKLAAPEMLAGAIVPGDGGGRAEMAWSAPPAPEGAGFLVEVARLPAADERSGEVVLHRRTKASALAVSLPRPDAAFAWRVSRVSGDGAHYRAGPWQRLGPGGDVARLPAGRVTLRVAAEDSRARTLARELASSLAGAGFWVRIETADEVAEETNVRFGYAEDADLAGSIAALLPVLDREDTTQSAEAGVSPGEVVVALAGGPDRALSPFVPDEAAGRGQQSGPEGRGTTARSKQGP